ncbi:hypothetical protein CR513_35626, partial [Mucuna pruriens]
YTSFQNYLSNYFHIKSFITFEIFLCPRKYSFDIINKLGFGAKLMEIPLNQNQNFSTSQVLDCRFVDSTIH